MSVSSSKVKSAILVILFPLTFIVLDSGPQYAVEIRRFPVIRLEVVVTLQAEFGVAKIVSKDVTSNVDKFSIRWLFMLTGPLLG